MNVLLKLLMVIGAAIVPGGFVVMVFALFITRRKKQVITKVEVEQADDRGPIIVIEMAPRQRRHPPGRRALLIAAREVRMLTGRDLPRRLTDGRLRQRIRRFNQLAM